VEAYAKEQGMWLAPGSEDYTEPEFSEYMELDLSTVVPSIAGPKRPQDRIAVNRAKEQFHADLKNYVLCRRYIEACPVHWPLADTFTASASPSHDAHEEASPLGHSTCYPVSESKRAHKLVDVTAADGSS